MREASPDEGATPQPPSGKPTSPEPALPDAFDDLTVVALAVLIQECEVPRELVALWSAFEARCATLGLDPEELAGHFHVPDLLRAAADAVAPPACLTA